ncbi:MULTISPECIES: 1-phosphofructokinase family hexose kinase [Amycolatopsis]|uniref:1-phosphofructokinase family hexose kinase n=1 Tax=Amycolatopsis dongchuanensis TaxID=1070866 RepID=A0ABP8VNI1_9PSEU
MIVVVCPNLALDVTYHMAVATPGAANRVDRVTTMAGGKGVNVARVLTALGAEATVLGFSGGRAGNAVRADLAASGVPQSVLPVSGETRRTVAVVEESTGRATLYLEPGPVVSHPEWAQLLARFAELMDAAALAVLSGSLPPGLPVDAYAQLVRLARQHGVPALVDADGEPLLRALAERPALIKPNADELVAATELTDPLAAARALRERGSEAVVASLGPDGLLAVDAGGTWRARPPERFTGNPTGAGDSAVAALALGLVDATPWPRRLAEAVALSAATVLSPVAGGFDLPAYRRLRGRIRVTRIEPDEEQSCPK